VCLRNNTLRDGNRLVDELIQTIISQIRYELLEIRKLKSNKVPPFFLQKLTMQRSWRPISVSNITIHAYLIGIYIAHYHCHGCCKKISEFGGVRRNFDIFFGNVP
jgi:hypothetical protein